MKLFTKSSQKTVLFYPIFPRFICIRGDDNVGDELHFHQVLSVLGIKVEKEKALTSFPASA